MPTSRRVSRAQCVLLLTVELTILVCWAWNIRAAESVTLAWDPESNIAGYRLYTGITSRVYTQEIDVGNTTSTLVSNLVAGQTYFFAVTAYNAAGLESAFSNEVSYAPSASPTPTPSPTASPTPTPTPTPIEAITGETLGTLRNNLNAGVGFRFMANRNISVKAVGRWVVSGNSGTHTIAIYDLQARVLASATVNTDGAPPGKFVYANLSSPLALATGSIYYILSTETNGADKWANDDTTVTSTSTITLNGSAYLAGGIKLHHVGGYSYGPVNFKY